MTDRELLQALIAEDERLTEAESKAFEGMTNYLSEHPHCAGLTQKQRLWADAVAKRLEIDVLPSLAKALPVGRPIETPEVLRNLPKRPPGRRA